jgi:predicted PurR-regulated permease PerM
LRPVILLGAIALVVAILYMARALLMPIAVAILLTFLLHPLVSALERRRVPRILAVVLVVALVFSALGALVSTMAWQVTSLAAELPRYRDNMRRKVAEIRGAGQGGVVEEVTETAREVTKELEKSDQSPPPGERPLPVVVRSERTGLWQLPSLLEGLAGAGVVVVLVIFMLLERDELRDRLFRLIGYARLTTTTRALDEAGRRISRYLLMQTAINVTFGLGVGVGLALIGLPYAALWGVLGAILRFIPYVGPWIAALAPIALSVATAVGWQQPILVAGLFLVLELLANMVLEPVLYGQSAGVSQVALLIAVAFWTWLWGAVGLALATPLTVCLVVLGKYVPELGFIGVLMADQPPLAHDARFYQRLLALDRDGAAGVVRDYEGEHVYDRVVVPALNRLERDHARGALDAGEHEAAVRVAREVLEADAAARREAGGVAPAGVPDAEAPQEAPRRLLLGAPARGASDEVALHLLRYLLEPAGWEVEVLSPRLLAAELLAAVEARRPAAVCIGAVPSGAAAAHTRYLCKRLRARFPELRLVVGRWAPGARVARIGDRILASGADHFATTLVGTRDQIRLLARLDLDAPREPVPAGPAPA